MTVRPARRAGYTLLELLVVCAVLIILGTVVVPTLFSMRQNTQSKAGADILRSRMADARAKAMEDGTPYRLAVAADGKRVRVAPDTLEATGMNPQLDGDDDGSGPLVREDDLPQTVQATVLTDVNDMATQDKEGWVRIATFMPDGTCKEDTVEIEVKEPGAQPFVVRLRGLTGAVTILKGVLGGAQ